MNARLVPATAIARPRYVWGAIVLELITAIAAIPVGLSLLTDPSGSGVGLPSTWIEQSVFGSYLIPGLYLLAVNGIGMLVLAGLSLIRHWSAPWLTGALGVGLIVWIAVQVVVMPELHPLQLAFGTAGFALGFVSLFWLRETGQLRLWQ
jgi:hypothetical protein